jgi:Protein of unknown function (DUF3048) N-terminal domain/Protein of unknown function (DUF3048) C-terminal domain
MAALPGSGDDKGHQVRRRTGGTNRRRRWRSGLSLVVVALGGLALAACSSSAAKTAKATTTTTTTTTTVPVAQAICPLTGAPVPDGGGVPQRPALAVKVDNYPTARPQAGLDDADIVYEEPVEGGITRYVALFQCQQAPLVGPVRSARNIDVGILGQFGSPLLVHVGGIDPVLSNLNASPIVNMDLGNLTGPAVEHPPGRVAPYDTYTSTAAIWALRPADTAAPNPVFTYANTPVVGAPVSVIAIPFSNTANVVWRYDPELHAYQRFYVFAPDRLADHVQNTASNVIVQFVQVTYGPWLENDQGGLEVQANLYQNASGPAQVYRDGVEVTGSWQRSTLSQPTQYLSATGQPIPLRPGPTWVELVPTTVPVTTSPPAPPSMTTG